MIAMGKLPKSMQQKKRRSKSLRSQGNAAMNQRATSTKGLNRQQRRRMQQQGQAMENMEQIDAKRVIIQTADGNDLIIEEPQIIKVVQEGMEVYQVIGSAKESSAGNYAYESNSEQDISASGVEDAEILDENFIENSENVEETLSVEITEEDIKLVAMQTGVSDKVAKKALKDANGDLARAIIDLKTR
ncbi:NAC domain-containing protein [Candidatus Lokiarchaeum ossiferum]|uniref:NAC domain-containing protein n=1 Tax=Candidatus Lokiarchaeum ossiferum TaxID=2951803 RepID=UPI00352E0332